MLRLDSKNINFSGVSLIDEVQVASMSASHSGSSAYFSFNVERLDLYKENAEMVNADFDAFRETVFETV